MAGGWPDPVVVVPPPVAGLVGPVVVVPPGAVVAPGTVVVVVPGVVVEVELGGAVDDGCEVVGEVVVDLRVGRVVGVERGTPAAGVDTAGWAPGAPTGVSGWA